MPLVIYVVAARIFSFIKGKEPYNPEDKRNMEDDKESRILTYGALKSICEKLEKKVSSLQLQIFYLKSESTVQYKVIQQLKKLYATSSSVKSIVFRCMW